MPPEVFDKVAQEAAKQASDLEALSRSLDRLGARVSAVIGGTSTSRDKILLGHAADASSAAKKAAVAYREAADRAKRAASEAQASKRQRRGQRASGG